MSDDRARDEQRASKKEFHSVRRCADPAQPTTGISLKRLAAILHTNHAAIRQRATELGVSLVIGAESDGAIDTRTIRCSNRFIHPLLERLKDVHGK